MNFAKSWKTTITGVASFAIGGLVAFGVFSPDDAAVANTSVVNMIEQVSALIFTITGVIGLFSRDNDVTSEESGATEAARIRSLKR